MPLHDFRCIRCTAVFEQAVEQGVDNVGCSRCPGVASKVFLRAPMGYVQPDICYDSPIDGRPVTSKQARVEDLRRNGCVEYEPGMRQDFERGRQQRDAELDLGVERTVDEFLATAGTRKVEKLEQELRAGASVELQRATPDLTKGVVQ